MAPEADPTQPGLRRVQARRRLTSPKTARLTSPKTAAPSSATTRHNGLATEFGLTRDPARWGAPGVGTRQGAVHAESVVTGFVTRVDAAMGVIVTFYANVHGLVPAKALAKLHRGGGPDAPAGEPPPLSARGELVI